MTHEQEILVYGSTEENIEKMFSTLNDPDSNFDRLFYALSILSDVQELIERGYIEEGRQCINKAKYFMSKPIRALHESERRASTLVQIRG